MLRPIPAKPKAPAGAARRHVALVASKYNLAHVDGLLQGAEAALRDGRATSELVRVPGAFEIPVVVETLLARSPGKFAAVICLGVIIRGATAHADLVGDAVTRALMEIAVRHQVPVIHEVLLVDDVQQADQRCLDPGHNRGTEAGQTALAMAEVVTDLKRAATVASGRRTRR